MTTYYPSYYADRLLYDTNRSGIAADNIDVTNWPKTSKFIIAIMIGYVGKDTAASAYKLQWRNVTDSGVFADVAATGEMKYSATSAVLVDGNSVDDAGDDRRLTPIGLGMVWQDGLENVNDNVLPDSGTFNLGDNCYTEFQWAIDPADSLAGHKYEFRMYNTTSGAALSTNSADITISSAERRVFITHQ